MRLARDIIVIGASAGGLGALCRLTGGFPATLKASVLIVLHTHPDGPGLLVDVIGRYTPLPVSYGSQAAMVEQGHIYIAPPDYHLTVHAPGYLRLDRGPKESFTRPAADALFRSAANTYGNRVIGVVLTGNGADGTAGLKAIKAVGGLSVIQNPADAEVSVMPSSALSIGSPDYMVSLSDMPTLLIRLVEGKNTSA